MNHSLDYRHLRHAGLLAFLLCFSAYAFGQTKEIDAGVTACEASDYKTAIRELDKALAKPEELKEKALARAYAYRAQAKVLYLRKAKDNLPESSADMVRNDALSAYQDLKLAKQNDVDGKMAERITTNTKLELQLLLDLANAADDKATADDTPKEKHKDLYQDVVAYSVPAAEIDKFNYMAYALQGNGFLGLGDSTMALKKYHLADDWFFRSAPKDGDMTVAYIYIHIAELEWYLNRNIDVALKALEEGRKMLDGENLKIQSLSSRPPAEKAKFSDLHNEIIGHLGKCEHLLRTLSGK